MAQSALLYRAVFAHLGSRFGKALMIGVAASSLTLAGGCDTSAGKADKEVSDKLKAAQAKIAQEKTPPTDSNADLKQASAETTDSVPMQIHAKIVFANSELRLAQQMAGKVLTNDRQIDRLTREIGMLAGEINDNNVMAASFQQAGPDDKGKRSMDTLTSAQTALATGSDDKGTWIKTDAGTLLSLATVDKNLEELKAQVATLTASIASATDERGKLLDEADKLTRQSQDTSALGTDPTPKARLDWGQKSVELYSQGADNRKKAADLSVKIGEDNAKLARTQADLAMQQGQHDSLTATKAALDSKLQTFKDSWSATQAEIAKVDEKSKMLLGENPVEMPKIDSKDDLKTDSTIGSKAAAIAQLVSDDVKPRADAIAHFDKAISLYKDAGVVAKKFTGELSTRMNAPESLTKPEQVAWKAEREVLDPNAYSYMQGDAELQKANLLAHTAAEAKLRLDQLTMLKPILTTAHLTPLPTLDETQPTNLADLIKSSQGTPDSGAIGSFTKAEALLRPVATGTSPLAIRAGAATDEIYLEYAWASLETLAGNPTEAGNHMSNARDRVGYAISLPTTLPPLPPDLTIGGAISVPTAAPPAVSALDLIGTYTSEDRVPQGVMKNTVVLLTGGTLTADGTQTPTGGKASVIKGQGTWKMQPGYRVLFTMTSLTVDGVPQPLAAVPPQILTIANGGKQLISSDGNIRSGEAVNRFGRRGCPGVDTAKAIITLSAIIHRRNDGQGSQSCHHRSGQGYPAVSGQHRGPERNVSDGRSRRAHKTRHSDHR